MSKKNDFENFFLQQLPDVPEMPDCYPAIIGHINRKKHAMRFAWAAAAAMLVTATSVFYLQHDRSYDIPTEVSQELQNINTHINGDYIKQEALSYSLLDDSLY
jgi:hypothetical protein